MSTHEIKLLKTTNESYLDVTDHNRELVGFKYVYPVVSRRAGGVSIGINLNTNNACNWRCIYCQVPNLTRGYPEPVDTIRLESELEQLLKQILQGDFMEKYVEASQRVLQDVAFSGNGEPTSAKEFPQAIQIVDKLLKKYQQLGNIKVRLITNGSMLDKPSILQAIAHLNKINGEVWFKLDAGSTAAIKAINDVTLNPQTHIKRLIACAKLCLTWVQTCRFDYDARDKDYASITEEYLALLKQVANHIQGVHLYGLARTSYQPEAQFLRRLSPEKLQLLGDQIRALGIAVIVNP